jgi:hypothetical protein
MVNSDTDLSEGNQRLANEYENSSQHVDYVKNNYTLWRIVSCLMKVQTRVVMHLE